MSVSNFSVTYGYSKAEYGVCHCNAKTGKEAREICQNDLNKRVSAGLLKPEVKIMRVRKDL